MAPLPGYGDRSLWAAEGGRDLPGIPPELTCLGCGEFPARLVLVHLIDERVESAASRTIVIRICVGQEPGDLAQGADEARLLLGRERTLDGLDQALARVGWREDGKHAGPGACVEGGGTPRIEDHGADVKVGQTGVESAPTHAAVGTPEDAAAGGACVEGRGGLGVDREVAAPEIGQPGAE